MKNYINYLLIVIILLNVFYIHSFSKNVVISGYIFLENNTDHSGIEIVLEKIEPTKSKDTIFSSENGFYNIAVEEGIYNLQYKKPNYGTVNISNQMFFSDKILDTLTMKFIGLSGKIAGKLTKGVYTVVGNLKVNTKDTLIIEPGVELRFKEDICLDVYGTLLAIGTKEDSIVFTRFDDTTAWGGIKFGSQAQNKSVLSYAVIEYGKSYGIKVSNSNVILEYLLVRRNATKGPDYTGAGMVFAGSNSILRNSVITENNIGKKNMDSDGGGIYFVASSQAVVENTIVSYNAAEHGGGIYIFDSKPILRNVIVYGNTANIGAGVAVFQFNYTLENVIVVNNTAEFGGGICSGGNNNNVNNCIIAFNKGWGIEGSAFSNCCVFDNEPDNIRHCNEWAGVNVKINRNGDSCDVFNNIFMDPKFIDYENNNYHLKAGSSCIDAGLNDEVKINVDFLGNKRIWDGNDDGTPIVDIGAFEYNSELRYFMKILEKNDFENGMDDWTVLNNNDECNWEIIFNPDKAYSGNNYLKIDGNASDCNLFLISPEIALPADSLSYFCLFAKTENEINPFAKERVLLLQDDKSMIKILVSENSTDINDFTFLEHSTTNINEYWQKYGYDLSTFSGKTIYIAIETNIENSSSFYFDEIAVKTSGFIPNSCEDNYYENLLINIFPNPASDRVMITGLNGNSKIKIYDILGNLCFEKSMVYATNEALIDISGFENGIYFVQIISGHAIYLKKVSVIK